MLLNLNNSSIYIIIYFFCKCQINIFNYNSICYFPLLFIVLLCKSVTNIEIVMKKVKISVLKTDINHELAVYYAKDQITACPIHQVGQDYYADFNCPVGFCNWAWNDIQKYVLALMSGGNFSEDAFEGWMKEKNIMIACCTDGLRPVTFKLELVNK